MAKILLIEDDRTMTNLLRTLLRYEGYAVASLPGDVDMDVTLEGVAREKPDLVLLDVHLQNISGFDLLNRLRQDQQLKSIPVLMSSGMDLRARCREAGADGFILKPYMPEELVATIKQITSKKE